MTRKTIERKIRRHGGDCWIKPRTVDGELKPAKCYFQDNNRKLLNVDADIQPGDLLHPFAKPHQLYLVTERRELILYEEYAITRISHHAQLYRHGADTVRDTFGRVVADGPALVDADVPLVLLPAVSGSDDSAPDRSATTSGYSFLTNDSFQVLPKDRLGVGEHILVVDSVQLTTSGLVKFTASITA